MNYTDRFSFLFADIYQDIHRDQSKFVKLSLRGEQSSLSGSVRSETPLDELNSRISSAYEQVSKLASEKIALAQQLVSLLTRTKARLESDVNKVRTLQGEALSYSAPITPSMSRRTASSVQLYPLGDMYSQPKASREASVAEAIEPPTKSGSFIASHLTTYSPH